MHILRKNYFEMNLFESWDGGSLPNPLAMIETSNNLSESENIDIAQKLQDIRNRFPDDNHFLIWAYFFYTEKFTDHYPENELEPKFTDDPDGIFKRYEREVAVYKYYKERDVYDHNLWRRASDIEAYVEGGSGIETRAIYTIRNKFFTSHFLNETEEYARYSQTSALFKKIRGDHVSVKLPLAFMEEHLGNQNAVAIQEPPQIDLDVIKTKIDDLHIGNFSSIFPKILGQLHDYSDMTSKINRQIIDNFATKKQTERLTKEIIASAQALKSDSNILVGSDPFEGILNRTSRYADAAKNDMAGYQRTLEMLETGHQAYDQFMAFLTIIEDGVRIKLDALPKMDKVTSDPVKYMRHVDFADDIHGIIQMVKEERIAHQHIGMNHISCRKKAVSALTALPKLARLPQAVETLLVQAASSLESERAKISNGLSARAFRAVTGKKPITEDTADIIDGTYTEITKHFEEAIKLFSDTDVIREKLAEEKDTRSSLQKRLPKGRSAIMRPTPTGSKSWPPDN